MDQDFTALRRFVRPRVAVERCDLCSAEVAQEHPHLVELATRQLYCACDPCAILFSNQGEHKYTRVPRRILFLPDFALTDIQWSGLMLPIQLAFFLNSTPDERLVALYPSPCPAQPNHNCRLIPGTRSLKTIRSWKKCSLMSRRCWLTASATSANILLRRSTSVTSWWV